MSGLLCLQWNNHTTAFLKKIGQVRDKSLYCDATIVCQGKYFKVHRLILSTCSEYFEEIFENIECKHPFIVIKDIVASELEALLNYMYLGEVNVLQDVLPDLINAAEALRIRGLAVCDDDAIVESDRNSKKRDRLNSISDTVPPAKKYLKQDSETSKQKVKKSHQTNDNMNNNQSIDEAFKENSDSKEENEENMIAVKVEPEDFLASHSLLEESQSQDTILAMMYEDDDCKSNEQPQCSSWEGLSGFSNDKQSAKRETGKKKVNIDKYQCPICEYSSPEIGKLRRHIRCVHTGEKPFSCTFCSYRTGDQSCLRKHYFSHKGKAFQCLLCPFSSAQHHKLDEHNISHALN